MVTGVNGNSSVARASQNQGKQVQQVKSSRVPISQALSKPALTVYNDIVSKDNNNLKLDSENEILELYCVYINKMDINSSYNRPYDDDSAIYQKHCDKLDKRIADNGFLSLEFSEKLEYACRPFLKAAFKLSDKLFQNGDVQKAYSSTWTKKDMIVIRNILREYVPKESWKEFNLE